MATYKKLLKNRAGDTIIPVTDRDVYSTTEQVIGEWIDGKPLYRRVFTGTATTMPFSVATLTNCNVKNIYGRITYNGSNYHQIGAYANANYYSLAQQNYSNYNIDLYGSSNYVGQQYELVAEYTKTTD